MSVVCCQVEVCCECCVLLGRGLGNSEQYISVSSGTRCQIIAATNQQSSVRVM